MIKQVVFLFFISIGFFACNSQKQPMDIRYTSINDYDANYIFNLENNTKALKKIDQYAQDMIKGQMHIVDSLKNSDYIKNTSKTYDEHKLGTSLSLTATDVYLYTPPGEFSFDQVQDENLVIKYELDEEKFTIRDIIVGNSYQDSSIKVESSVKENNCKLIVSTATLNLQGLYQIFEKIRTSTYHKQKEQFTYFVYDANDTNVLDIIYKNNGSSLLLHYK